MGEDESRRAGTGCRFLAKDAIALDPWAPAAETVLRRCNTHPIYGTSDLWRT